MPDPLITPSLEAAYRKAVEENSHVQGLTGIDVGFKYENGVRTEEVSVRFMVRAKRPLANLPKEEQLPLRDLGESTDVNAAPFRFAAAGIETPHRRERCNPIQPGISVSQEGRGAGTLGAIVYLGESREPAILSCSHVLAPVQAGGDPHPRICQPSLVDGGDPRFDVIGHLEDGFLDKDGDAAVARLTRSRLLAGEQLATGVEVIAARRVRLGEELVKSGRGTGVTHAKVDGIGRYLLEVRQGEPTWVEGFRLVPVAGKEEEISARGDSGAIWMSPLKARKALGVGLHVEGEKEDEQEYAIACHLDRVMERFGASFSPVPLSEKEVRTWSLQNPDQARALATELLANGGIRPPEPAEPKGMAVELPAVYRAEIPTSLASGRHRRNGSSTVPQAHLLQKSKNGAGSAAGPAS